jgi:hypothetical protein
LGGKPPAWLIQRVSPPILPPISLSYTRFDSVLTPFLLVGLCLPDLGSRSASFLTPIWGTSGSVNPSFGPFLLVSRLYCFDLPEGDFVAVAKIKTNPAKDQEI